MKEVDELRFVLCPKRMTDRQFWQTYFQLACKHLPPAAFESAENRDQAGKGQQPLDLQARLQQLSASAQQWGASTAASVAALGRPASSREAAGMHTPPPGRGNDKNVPNLAATQAGNLDADPDLEAYLRVQYLAFLAVNQLPLFWELSRSGLSAGTVHINAMPVQASCGLVQ